MAPASGKRKRVEHRPTDDDGSGRASPFKPEKTRLASRRVSQAKTLAEEAGSERSTAEMAVNTPVNGGSNAVNEASHPQPLVKSTPDKTGRYVAIEWGES